MLGASNYRWSEARSLGLLRHWHMRYAERLAARGRSLKAPLTDVRGSVDSVRYRAATVRERLMGSASKYRWSGERIPGLPRHRRMQDAEMLAEGGLA